MQRFLLALALVLPSFPSLANSNLRQRVIGYHTAWNHLDAPWEHLSHLNYFAVQVTPAGTLVPWAEGYSASNFSSLVTQGHAHGVKVGLVLVAEFPSGMTYAQFQDNIHTWLTGTDGPSHLIRTTVIQNLLQLVQAADADGVDVDVEFPRAADAQAYIDFVRELNTALTALKPTTHYLTVAVPQWDYPGLGSAGNNQNAYLDLAMAADAINVMGYGYHWDGSDPGPVSPISIGTTWAGASPPYDLQWTVNYYEAKLGTANRNRLNMGFPFYGSDWPATSPTVPGTKGVGQVTIPNVPACEASFAMDRQWDADSQTPYRVYGSGDGGWRQLFCEDVESMRAKFSFSNGLGWGGVLFWAENYIPSNHPYWNLVDRYFSLDPLVNQDPVVSIAPVGLARVGQPLSVNGSATHDPDVDDGLILQWHVELAPAGTPPAYTQAHLPVFSVTPQQRGMHTLSLRASDGVAETTGFISFMVWDVGETPSDGGVLDSGARDAGADAGARDSGAPLDASVRDAATLDASEAGDGAGAWDGASSDSGRDAGPALDASAERDGGGGDSGAWDANVPGLDASSSPTDAAARDSAALDAQAAADASASGPGEDSGPGDNGGGSAPRCSCRAPQAGPGAYLWLIGAAVLARRRHRSR